MLSKTLPLVGRVAAGRPIEVLSQHEELEVPESMIEKTGTFFSLLVEGDSMIEDGILDGDFVVIKKQSTANNGDTVVALIDNEATIKRFYKKKNTIELHPANSNYQPIVVHPNTGFKIEGVLAGVIRKY